MGKPKDYLSQVEDITQKQIVIVDANNISQFQFADAESQNLNPARNQLAYQLVANDLIDAEKALTDETTCTNTDTKVHYTDNDSLQALKLQPGRQLMNSDPFMSNLNSLELINDIDTFNTVSTQVDPEKDKVIAEALIPVVDNSRESNMDDDIFFSWGADSLMNSEVDMSHDPMNPMTMVNPVEVEGKEFVIKEVESENTTNCSTTTDDQSVTMQESNGVEVISEKDVDDIVKDLDEEFLASILQDVELGPENHMIQNDVPAAQEPDLLNMVIDDSIGMESMAEFFSSQPECSTVNLQDINVSNQSEVISSNSIDASDEQLNSVESTPMHTPVRRGPGRPKKPRTTERVVRPRGRPARIHTENTNEHHNYSNDSSSMSTAERRYRRMRDLNNIASQRCRLKRKSKMQNALDELKEEENRNKELSMKVRILEEQVKALKQHFITKISNPQKRVVLVPSPDTMWNAEQFESFVNDTVTKHLEEN